jgi:D-glycero-D-manno-heptose 1,7-bisphosphate phosphatase
MTRVRQAVFLVGGKGTRLGALTASTPKPLIEIAPGLRFLDVLLEHTARHGFTDIILLAGHHGEQVQQAYHGRTVREATISVITEPAPAGTGGALLHAADRLAPWFLMANGDSYFEFNLRALATGLGGNLAGRMALRRVSDVSRYGMVEMAGDRIAAFREKTAVHGGAGLINAGVYLLSRNVLEHVAMPCSIESDVFPRLAQAGRLLGTEFDGYFLDIGLPETYEQARREVPGRLSKPAVFLDRDGVLNVDSGYPHRREDLVWIKGAREAVLRFNEVGYLVIVLTNQAGVARGFYDEAQVADFHSLMQDDLAAIGAHVDAFYFCPFHADAAIEAYRVADHPDRKPNPGMLLRAMSDWPVRSAGSFLIGDRDTDLEAARRASVPGYKFGGGDLHAFVTKTLAEQPCTIAPSGSHARSSAQ